MVIDCYQNNYFLVTIKSELLLRHRLYDFDSKKIFTFFFKYDYLPNSIATMGPIYTCPSTVTYFAINTYLSAVVDVDSWIIHTPLNYIILYNTVVSTLFEPSSPTLAIITPWCDYRPTRIEHRYITIRPTHDWSVWSASSTLIGLEWDISVDGSTILFARHVSCVRTFTGRDRDRYWQGRR